MSDRVNQITKDQERQGGAVSLKYSYTHQDVEKNKTKSFVNERLYLPGYAEVGGSHKYAGEELWAAFASNRSGADDVSAYAEKHSNKKIDQDLANSFMSAMDPEVVEHDDLAQKFFVKLGASTEELSNAGIGITTGVKVIERETNNAKSQEEAGKISNLEIKDVKLRNYETELAEGATQVVSKDANEKEWTKTFVNNRKYLTYSGDENKREVFEQLAKDNSFVKKDGFAMNHYIEYDASYEDIKSLEESTPGLRTTRGHRAADYMVSLCDKVDDLSLVNVDHMSSAAYTVMREEYIKKAEAAKIESEAKAKAEAEEKGPEVNEKDEQEAEKEFDTAMSGPSRGR